MTTSAWNPIFLSVKCGLVSGLLTLPWGIGWGWLLARHEFRGKMFLQTLLMLPLVLPPVLTGYILLSLSGLHSPLGRFLDNTFAFRFVLDWKGCVLAAFVVSSPFMVQCVKQSMEQVDGRLELIARSLGASWCKVFWSITLPLCWPGLAAGFAMVFARSVGEFGATIILAGNIPLKTQTISLAIYNKVYLGQETSVVPLACSAFVLSYLGLGASEWFTKKRNCHQ
ncbi:MAG: molybdate ABC transporter permease subunit [Candidatus Omnitrophota bacterium]|jgi:molybdate transport system permease protein